MPLHHISYSDCPNEDCATRLEWQFDANGELRGPVCRGIEQLSPQVYVIYSECLWCGTEWKARISPKKRTITII